MKMDKVIFKIYCSALTPRKLIRFLYLSAFRSFGRSTDFRTKTFLNKYIVDNSIKNIYESREILYLNLKIGLTQFR